jgi:hypothetical protein
MVAILVHWLIKKGSEPAFESRWRAMKVDPHAGLHREILARLDSTSPRGVASEDRFHTFSIGDPFYSTFINIGLWDSLESFDAAIGKYIPSARVCEQDGKRMRLLELEDFEFKLRERIVLEVIGTRGGDLPPADVQ